MQPNTTTPPAATTVSTSARSTSASILDAWIKLMAQMFIVQSQSAPLFRQHQTQRIIGVPTPSAADTGSERNIQGTIAAAK